jgi:hypothetical protein
MGKTTKYTERKFLGVLPENASKIEIRFHQKHEKAYLKGHEFFRFGYQREIDPDTGGIYTARDFNGHPIPLWHKVQQEVIVDEELKAKLTKK